MKKFWTLFPSLEYEKIHGKLDVYYEKPDEGFGKKYNPNESKHSESELSSLDQTKLRFIWIDLD